MREPEQNKNEPAVNSFRLKVHTGDVIDKLAAGVRAEVINISVVTGIGRVGSKAHLLADDDRPKPASGEEQLLKKLNDSIANLAKAPAIAKRVLTEANETPNMTAIISDRVKIIVDKLGAAEMHLRDALKKDPHAAERYKMELERVKAAQKDGAASAPSR